MAYKKNIKVFNEILKENLMKGKNTKLLVKGYYDDEFYQVKEFTAFVKSSRVQMIKGKKMKKLQLLFDSNKIVETVAFCNDIKSGDFVSVIGYFSSYNDTINFNCKGGINKIMSKGKEMAKFNIASNYRMGLVFNLSKIEFSGLYRKNENFIKIEEIPDFYYLVEDIIDEKQEDSTIYDDEEEEEEEFFDIDFEEISE